MSDLVGYVMEIEEGGTITVVGPSISTGYVEVHVEPKDGKPYDSLRVEAQVRRHRELTQMTRWDDPTSDPIADIKEALERGFDQGIQPTQYIVPPERPSPFVR